MLLACQIISIGVYMLRRQNDGGKTFHLPLQQTAQYNMVLEPFQDYFNLYYSSNFVVAFDLREGRKWGRSKQFSLEVDRGWKVAMDAVKIIWP
jgi:hypothetical protein